MTWPSGEDLQRVLGAASHDGNSNDAARIRLSKGLPDGHDPSGESIWLSKIPTEYQLDRRSAVGLLADLHALEMVTLWGTNESIVRSPHPKGMYAAYEIRATLEEIGGRAATHLFKSNTAELQNVLDALRAAVRTRDVDSLAKHDVQFRRCILQASANQVLLRVRDSLVFDVRIRVNFAKVVGDLLEVVKYHQPIIDDLERGQGNEVGLLLRNHLETFLQLLKNSEVDSVLFHRDLEIAREVQKASFPQLPTRIPGLSCAVFYKPVHSVGGDYYDFISLQNGAWGIAIGDVSGKGIGAALVMANLQGSLRAHTLHLDLDPETLISNVNRLVCESSPSHFFASLFYAEYQPVSRVLRYVNAGHNPPIVLRRNRGRCGILPLTAESVPVGFLKDSQFTSTTFQLEVGDVLVAYTDGITESENSVGDPFGKERLERILCDCACRNPHEILQHIVDELSAYSGGCSQIDDITLMVMQVQAQAAVA